MRQRSRPAHVGLLLVLNGSGAVKERDLTGPGLSQIIATETGISGSSAGTVEWALTNQVGSVTDVLNNSGGVIDHTRYDSFGNVEYQSDSANAMRFGYAGMITDSATGFDYDNARYYNPETGTFISQDPLNFRGGDYNLYRYAGNDPSSVFDPSGMAVSAPGSPIGSGANSSLGNQQLFGGGSSSSDFSNQLNAVNQLNQEGSDADQFPNGLSDNWPQYLPTPAQVVTYQSRYLAWLKEAIARESVRNYQFTICEGDLAAAGQLYLSTAQSSPFSDASTYSFSGQAYLALNGLVAPLYGENGYTIYGNQNYQATVQGIGDAASGLNTVVQWGGTAAAVVGTGAMGLEVLAGEGAMTTIATDGLATAGGLGDTNAAGYVANRGCFRAGTLVTSGSGDLRRIETICLGQRVATPGKLDSQPIDPSAYRMVHVQFVRDGQEFNMSFLRPAQLLEGLGAGDTIQLDVFELRVTGPARVIGVEPCPPIEDSPGRLVTGMFRSDSVDMRRITLVGLAEPIDITENHAVFSEDHQDFVSARVLQAGGKLRTADGRVAIVESNVHLAERCEVFNLEIDEAHQYYVTKLAVLVHNANDYCLYGLTGFSDPVTGQAMHDAFNSALNEQLGTIPGDWEMYTEPGQNGVDAVWRGPKCRYPGFDYAELKPVTDWSNEQFWNQFGKWTAPGGGIAPGTNTQLWYYNENGVIGTSGYNFTNDGGVLKNTEVKY